LRAFIEKNKYGTFLILIPTTNKQKDQLDKLWRQLPDITFEKRGCIIVERDRPTKSSFVIKINNIIERGKRNET